MAFKNLTGFGAGEISPELFERDNLEKFQTGLNTGRNVLITKAGGLRSRAGTTAFLTPKYTNKKYRNYHIPQYDVLYELGDNYVRVYTDFNDTTFTYNTLVKEINTTAFGLTEAAIQNAHICNDDNYVYIFVEDQQAVFIPINSDILAAMTYGADTILPTTDGTVAWGDIFYPSLTITATGTYLVSPPVVGYDVDYLLTLTLIGDVETPEEPAWVISNSTGGSPTQLKIPVNAGEKVDLTAVFARSGIPARLIPRIAPQMYVYRRPHTTGSGGWGFVGAMAMSYDGTNYTFKFTDLGGEADFTNRPPELVAGIANDWQFVVSDPAFPTPQVRAKTGYVYQGRLIFSGSKTKSITFGSRSNSTEFTTDWPVQDDSAIAFKAGVNGGAQIKRYFDSRGLMVFTNAGIYETQSDLLTPETAFALKRSNIIIDDIVHPLGVENVVMVIDYRNNSVAAIEPVMTSTDQYRSSEVSIWSKHLLQNHRIVSWDIQYSDAQYIWMVREDGVLLSLSYSQEQQMQAWSRHDIQGTTVENATTITSPSGKQYLILVVNRAGVRSTIRLINRDDLDFVNFIATDLTVVYKDDVLVGKSPATIAPVSAGVWSGNLTVTPASGSLTGSSGDVFRVFFDDNTSIDLTFVSVTGGVLTVTPSYTYPSTEASIVSLYKTTDTITGLDALDGAEVAVRLDGFTHASPLNTEKNYEVYTVSSGSITLVSGVRGAIISVGLPIVTDIVTLEPDSIEESPTKLNAKITNRLWLSYYQSRPIYVASQLPDDDTITNMDLQEFEIEPTTGILATIPPQPFTGRPELQIQGTWDARGAVALRNVDPQPIGLRGIFLDVEVTTNGT